MKDLSAWAERKAGAALAVCSLRPSKICLLESVCISMMVDTHYILFLHVRCPHIDVKELVVGFFLAPLCQFTAESQRIQGVERELSHAEAQAAFRWPDLAVGQNRFGIPFGW